MRAPEINGNCTFYFSGSRIVFFKNKSNKNSSDLRYCWTWLPSKNPYRLINGINNNTVNCSDKCTTVPLKRVHFQHYKQDGSLCYMQEKCLLIV